MRLAGLALQVIGIGLGIPALIATRRLFGLPSFANSAREWLKRRPRFGVDISMPAEGLKFRTKLGQIEAEGWSGMGPELSTTQRLASLVENIERLRTKIHESNEEHRAAIAQLRTETEATFQGADAKLSDEAQKLRESQTGGLAFAMAALVLIIVGTVLAGIAPDVGRVLPEPGLLAGHASNR